MACPSAEPSGNFFWRVRPLELIAAKDFARVEQLVLGRRCENLKPSMVQLKSLSAAVGLVNDLLASEIGWPNLVRMQGCGQNSQSLPERERPGHLFGIYVSKRNGGNAEATFLS